MLLVQVREGVCVYEEEDGPGSSPDRCAGDAHASLLQKAGRPCRHQVCTHLALLAPIDAKRQLEQKGWGLCSLHGVISLRLILVQMF